MSKLKIGTQDVPVCEKISLTVTEKGPILVQGRVPLAQQFIMPNTQGASWYFQQGESFSTDEHPTALCRCGASRRKPYCDGSHAHADWDPTLTASEEPLLEGAEVIEGGGVSMTDNDRYCVFARFCDPHGSAWELTEQSDDPRARELAVREASMCPGGRLTAWDNTTHKAYEFRFEPSLGLIEDPAIRASGGVWVRGGIPIRREDGTTYEVRNRVVLCRCGLSENKPYCDGTHASAKWHDQLKGEPHGETVPAEG